MFEVEDIVMYPSAKKENENKVALIDADTIVFGACSVHEQVEEVLPKEMYTEAEWNKLINDKNYDAEEEKLYSINIDDALAHAIEYIEKIKAMTGCNDAELYFTSGMHFRYEVDPDYKSNRIKLHRPPGLNELKALLLDTYKGDICTKWEADDHVAFLKKKLPEHYVLCAVDKDILKSIPGEHWNYYQSSKYNIQPKWVNTNEEEALVYNYKQAIMGDINDGIAGVQGIGKVGADKWLKDCTTEYEMWKQVVKAYESKGLSIIDAMKTMQLVSMHQLIEEDGEIVLRLFNPLELFDEYIGE
jgi:hypothetical protein